MNLPKVSLESSELGTNFVLTCKSKALSFGMNLVISKDFALPPNLYNIFRTTTD